MFLDDARAGEEDDDEDDIFASFDDSCSRLQSRVEMQPRCVIEYGQQPVNALAWSPWCSTEFAAVTDAGHARNLGFGVIRRGARVRITNNGRFETRVERVVRTRRTRHFRRVREWDDARVTRALARSDRRRRAHGDAKKISRRRVRRHAPRDVKTVHETL